MSGTTLVTGGTGTLGRLVVPLLRAAGEDVRVLSRTARVPVDDVHHVEGDLETGRGLGEAVRGVDKIVHLAGSAKGDGAKARRLLAALEPARIEHLVYISVVGADRVPVVSRTDRAMFGYFAEKRSAEQLIASSGMPFTTLRSTQFHDAMLTVVRQMARLPMIPVPSGVRFQPVDTAEVAALLAGLALGNPAGLVHDVGGPTAYGMGDLVRSFLRATGRRRLLVPMRMPGGAARAIRGGANLCVDSGAGGRMGGRTWEAFLVDQLRTAGRPRRSTGPDSAPGPRSAAGSPGPR